MNPFNAITFAALCGPLACPAAMAQDFIIQPAPVVAEPLKTTPSVEEFSRSLEEGKAVLQKLTASADDYYVSLIELDSKDARKIVNRNSSDAITEACEMFLRGFEEEVKRTIESPVPDFVKSELKIYWRHIAKARSSVTRLNDYTKSLFKDAVLFDGKADINGIVALANYTSDKIKLMQFH
ncbi:hypothetical protein C2U55_06610 [Enterobacteriaceae bacterium ENNIH3]|nr:hypothetical protein C2U55_06610 [Enterobacteriaceae bacterium ENNIH3]AUV10445.1 hypothetical protein C2U52_06350 [Enterobacteriaceae bacterium ENNIH2]